ncbi:zinc-ribbon domain-containing protein, partial [Candidatus Nomurabacteria bacterium]|nr:zinc-ribbon domain-containing protein [Candidatus Nomurabacteria bacterium]
TLHSKEKNGLLFCIHCGAENVIDSKYCISCGESIIS